MLDTRDDLKILLQRLPEATIALVEGDCPPIGQRHDSFLEVAYRAAESGLSNHEILRILSEVSERWKRYDDRNLYTKWTRLLGILRRVRKEFPNSCDGSGYAPSA
jgi:hypothetical protein